MAASTLEIEELLGVDHVVGQEQAEPALIPAMEQENNEEVVQTPWSWLVCMASFIMLFLVAGLHKCAGIVFTQLLERYNKSRSETAWVTSLATSSAHTFSLLATHLCQVYGCRSVALASSLLSAVALLSSAYSPTLWLLYLTYGLGFGLSSSLCCCSALLIIPEYFKQSLAFAISLSQLGAPVGTLALSPLLTYLFGIIGFRYTLVTLAGLQVVVMIAGLTFRPLQSTREEETKEVPSVKPPSLAITASLFKSKRFMVWLGCLFMFIPALLIPFVHLIRLAEDKGISEHNAGYLLYFVAVASTFTRPIVGRLSDWWPDKRLQFFQISFFVMSVANFLAPLATSFASLAVYSSVFGMFDGCLWTLLYIITFEIVGKDRFPSAVGWLLFLLSFPEVSGPPLAGWIYDVSRSYSLAFYVSGGVIALSALVMFVINRPTQQLSCLRTAPSGREEVAAPVDL